MRINWGPFLPRLYLLNRKVFVQKNSKISSQIPDPPKAIVQGGMKATVSGVVEDLKFTEGSDPQLN